MEFLHHSFYTIYYRNAFSSKTNAYTEMMGDNWNMSQQRPVAYWAVLETA